MEIKAIKNRVMTLITKAEMTKLVKAGEKYMNSDSIGRPIVKIFGGSLTWLITHIEIDTSEHAQHLLCGYADLGFGCVEYGSLIELSELPSMKIKFFYPERDRWFKDDKTVNYLERETLSGI